MAEERKDSLLAVVNHLERVWENWRNDSDAKEIDKAFVDATADCIEMFRTGSIPGDFRALHLAVESMGTQWTTWVEKYQTTPKAPAMPGRSEEHTSELQ